MRKSGLHKEIASIFDGVPVPSNSVSSEGAEAVDPQPAPQTAGSSLVQRMSADPSDVSEHDPIPVVQVGRPMPLSKSKAVSKAGLKPGFGVQIKKAIFGSRASLDPRQKKAGVLVGILTLVFGAVLFVSLGGVGQSQVAAANASEGDQTALIQAAQKTAQEWKRPESLPQDLRNATAPAASHSEPSQADRTADSGALVVKGIVFSKNKPSAIVNNQILSEGQSLDGVTVVKITPEAVEFEADGKRWTQFVQR